MYKNITKPLLISKELKQKIDFICKFASVKYELISVNIISIIDTNIGYVRPHIQMIILYLKTLILSLKMAIMSKLD